MPMTQDDIRQYYEKNWKQQSDKAQNHSQLAYSDAVADAASYPVLQQLIADLNIKVAGGRMLDVGCGSGRWLRYFVERFQPACYVGIDFAQSSIDLLRKWHPSHNQTHLDFRIADITDPNLSLGEPFDFVNVANVLFHIPEHEKFMQALKNLARLIGPTGRVITTEYLPRTTMRTEWMLVRSRYEFEQLVESVGLKIAAVRASGFFSNDPMGLDGLDNGLRGRFNGIRNATKQILQGNMEEGTRKFFLDFFSELEHTLLAFCRERISDVDMPAQKMVVLRKA